MEFSENFAIILRTVFRFNIVNYTPKNGVEGVLFFMRLNKRTLEVIKRKVLAYLLIAVMVAGIVTPLGYASANQNGQTQETEIQESGNDAGDLTEVDEGGDSTEAGGGTGTNFENPTDESGNPSTGDAGTQTEAGENTNSQASGDTNTQLSGSSNDQNSGTNSDSVREKWEAVDWANFNAEFDWYGLDEDTWNVVLDVLAAKLSAGEIDAALIDKIQQSARAYLDGKKAPMTKAPKARLLGAPAGGVYWSTFDWSSITDMNAFDWNAVDWSKVDFDSFDDDAWDMVYAAIDAGLLDDESLEAFYAAGEDWFMEQGAGAPMPLAGGELASGTMTYYKVSGENNREQISKGTTVEMANLEINNNNFVIQYDWDKNVFSSISPGIEYNLVLPQNMKAQDGLNGKKLPINPNGTTPELDPNNVLGTLVVSDGEVKVIFTNEGINSAKADGAHIGLNCSVVATKEDADSEGKLDINLGGEKVFTVKVDSLKPSNSPQIAKDPKNGTLSGDTATWTITYNPGDPNNPDSSYPDSFIDTLPTEFDKSSIQIVEVKVDGVPDNETKITHSIADDKNQVTFNINNPADKPNEYAKKPIVIKYSAKLSSNAISDLVQNGGNDNTSYTNTVEQYKGALPINNSDTAKVSPTNDQKTPFDKIYQGYNSDSNEVNWTIRVNIIGNTIPTTLIVKDEISNEASSFLSEIGNLAVNNTSVDVGDSGINEKKNAFTFNLGKWLSANQTRVSSDGEYEITYTTKLADGAFGQPQTELDAKALNNATLEFNNGNGTVSRSDSAVVIASDVSTSIIEKEALDKPTKGVLDSDGRLFKYKLTVNPNKRPVGGNGTITVIDQLTKADLEYFITDVAISGGTPGTIAYYKDVTRNDAKEFEFGTAATSDEKDRKVFKVTLSDMDNQKCEITVTVKLTDSNVFVGDATAQMDNTVYAYKNEDMVNAELDTASHVFELNTPHVKWVENYNPETQEVTWRVAANQDEDKVAIGKIEIEDAIPAGLKYVRSYLTNELNSTQIDADGSNYAENGVERTLLEGNETTGTKVKWNVNVQHPKRYDLHIVTKVMFSNDDYVADTSKVFVNSAIIRQGSAEYTATGRLTIPKPNVTDKKGEMIGNSSKVKYSVGINPLKQNILDSSGTGVKKIVLTDKLSSNLVLDTSTIKIYKATVGLTNAVNQGANVTLSEYKYTKVSDEEIQPLSQNYTFSTNTLVIEMPVPADGTTYLVEYEAYAISSGQLDNTITITGATDKVNDLSGRKTLTFNASAYGGAFSIPDPNVFASLEVKKVGTNGNGIVAGTGQQAAVFQAYDAETDGTLLGTVTANDIGLLVIEKVRLTGLTTIWLQETVPPTGYQPIPGRIEVKIADFDNGITITNLAENETPNNNAQLLVKKVDENKDPLAGAYVTLYSDPDCTNPLSSAQEIDKDTGTTFSGLTVGTFYYLKETPPPGYKGAEVRKVLAGTDGTITNPVIIENTKITTKLTIKKVDQNDNFLPGAFFTVYKDGNLQEVASGKVDGTEKDLKNLEVTFALGLVITDIKNGTYYVEETTVPDGYEKDSTMPKEVVVSDANSEVEIVVKNPKKPDPKPDPKPSGNEGNNGSDDSGDSSTTSPPAKSADNKTVVPNGKIPQTGQLWWPVWLMGGLGSLFLILGFLWKPKKKK